MSHPEDAEDAGVISYAYDHDPASSGTCGGDWDLTGAPVYIRGEDTGAYIQELLAWVLDDASGCGYSPGARFWVELIVDDCWVGGTTGILEVAS